MHLLLTMLSALLLTTVCGAAAVAQSPAPVPRQDALDRLLRTLALTEMPHSYEDDDDWGRTKEFTTGLHVSRDGLKIETRRKRRQLNHGLWQRYRVKLADAERFMLDVRDVRPGEDGKTAFTIEISAPLKLHVRRSRWRRGVQLWSVSADANASVRLRLDCQARLELDASESAPAVVLTPEVDAAEIRMTRFELTGVSKARGPVASELGDLLREYLEEKVARKNEKFVRKINERIEKKQDRLRFSLSALAETPLLRQGRVTTDANVAENERH